MTAAFEQRRPTSQVGARPLPIMQSASVPSLAGVSVLVVGINFPPEPTGIAPYNGALAQALGAAGADVRVVTGVPHYPMWKTQAPYDHLLRHDETADGLRVSRRRHFVPKQASLRGRALMESSFLAHATPSVLRSKADVIVAVTPSLAGLGAAAAGRRGRPLGVVLQDITGGAAEQTGAGSRVGGAISSAERRLLVGADRVGVISREFVKPLIDMGVDEDRIAHVPNFTHISPVQATAAEARRRLGWRDDRFMVVHTGNMGAKQGLHHVIDAARMSFDAGDGVQWVFVGDGNQRRLLEQRAAGLDNVTFVDPLCDDDYPYALAAADVLLLHENPGVREFCFPSKLTSYVVGRRPVLAATQSGSVTHRALTRTPFAHLVEPGDVQGLLQGVRTLRANPALGRQLVDAASLYAPETSRELAAERYVSFVGSLVR